MNEEQEVFYRLGVALAIGLLIGAERGWKEREAAEGGRIAGLRTYGLMGLLGGVTALVGARFGPLVVGLIFFGVAGALAAVYVANLRRGDPDVGITSLIATLLTFVLGVLAGMGEMAVAGASAVIVTLLLTYKPILHRWLRALEASELEAGIKLLLISVVLLPVLPDRGYGPYGALNPYAIWWMVVLIATISFVGYFAVKIGGPKRGALFTGLFGGLASSTALTLHFARSGRKHVAMAPVFSLGILLACGTMFPRLVLVASLLNADLLTRLLVPAAVMAALVYLPAAMYWHTLSGPEPDGQQSPLRNPLEIKAALGFGALLALVLLLGRFLRETFGEAGLLALAAASGITDVDAITLSLARMSDDGLSGRTAALGIIIAAAMNNLAKAAMAAAIGGRAMGFRVSVPLTASALAGVLTSWWLAR